MEAPGLTRRSLLAGGCLLGASLALGACGGPVMPTTTARRRTLVDPGSLSALDPATKAVALTFDDGPDPQFTPTVLDALAAAGAKATFFVIGRNAIEQPELVQRMLDEGHEVANHTLNHLWLDEVEPVDVRTEILGGERALSGLAAGTWFRPPRGRTSPDVVEAADAAGLRSVFWGTAFERYQHLGTGVAVSRVLADVRPGSIILAHDGGKCGGPNPQDVNRSRTVRAIPHILEGLDKLGLTSRTLSELSPGGGARA